MFKIKELKPKLVCFGHIHEGHGWSHDEDTIYSNGSQCNEYNDFKIRPLMYKINEETKNVSHYIEELPI